MAQARPPFRQRRVTLARRMNSRILRQRPARRYAVALAACLLTLLSAPSTAQPRLAVEPDTLFYSNQPGADNTLHLWNEGSDTLRIDSLRFSTFTAHGWVLRLVTSDSVYNLDYAFGELDRGFEFPAVALSSQDTAHVDIIAFGSCLLCGDTAPKHSVQEIRDTLFVYSNNEQLTSYMVPIDFARYVAVNQPDVLPPLSLEVYPNPSHRQATVRVVAERAGRYAVTLYDVLGQRLAQEHAWLAPGQAWELRWPGAGRLVPGGTYFARLTDGRVYTTKTLTLTR